MSKNGHLSMQQLLDVAEAGDGADVKPRVRDHLSGCETCRGEAAALRETLLEVVLDGAIARGEMDLSALRGAVDYGERSIPVDEGAAGRFLPWPISLVAIAAILLIVASLSIPITSALLKARLRPAVEPEHSAELHVDGPAVRFSSSTLATGESAGGSVEASLAGDIGLKGFGLSGRVQIAGAFDTPDVNTTAEDLVDLANQRAARELFNRGLASQRRGDLDEAARRYEAALVLDPELAPALRNLGTAYAQLDQPRRAAEVFDRLLKLGVTIDADLHHTLAVAFYNAGRYELASEHMESYVVAEPDDPAARVQLGMSYAQQQRLLEAVDQYRRAIDIDPGFAVAHFAIGAYYAALAESTDQFVIDALIAEVLNDEQLSARADLVELAEHAAEGSGEAAKQLVAQLAPIMQEREAAAYESAIRHAEEGEDGLFESWHNLGTLQMKRGQYESAVVSFRTASTLLPNHAGTLYNLGIAAAMAGDPETAEEAFSGVIKIAPGMLKAHLGLAKIYKVTGNSERLRDQIGILRLLSPSLAAEFETD